MTTPEVTTPEADPEELRAQLEHADLLLSLALALICPACRAAYEAAIEATP